MKTSSSLPALAAATPVAHASSVLDALRRRWAASLPLVAMVVCTAVPLAARAQGAAWPAKPVRLVVPFPAGAAPDVIARLLAERLTAQWGQTVIVDNKPGAGGITGMSALVQGAPDGYTLGFVPAAVATLADLISAAKAQPGKLNFAAAQTNSLPHLTGEMLGKATGTSFYAVPYSGSAAATTALLSGEAAMTVDGLPALTQYVKAGKLRALAVTSRERLPGFETVPTARETVPSFESVGWFGIFAPTGSPAGVIEQVNRDLNTVLQQAPLIARFAELGVYPQPGTPKAFDDFLQAQRAAWKKVVADMGLQPQ